MSQQCTHSFLVSSPICGQLYSKPFHVALFMCTNQYQPVPTHCKLKLFFHLYGHQEPKCALTKSNLTELIFLKKLYVQRIQGSFLFVHFSLSLFHSHRLNSTAQYQYIISAIFHIIYNNTSHKKQRIEPKGYFYSQKSSSNTNVIFYCNCMQISIFHSFKLPTKKSMNSLSGF